MGFNPGKTGNMKHSVLLLLVLFLFLGIPCLAGAKISVSLRLDRSEATLADSIRIVVSVSGTRSTDSKRIIKGLKSFTVQKGGTSSRVEIINGKVKAGIDYTFFIQPKKPGTFKIGPAIVTVEGKTFESNTETLMIVKPTRSSGQDRGPLFLSAELSAKNVYVEEQAIYTLKLYRQARVSDISLSLPKAEHFSFKQLGKPLEYQRVYNGESYQVLEIRYALVPLKEGNHAIEPSRMNLTVIQPRRRSSRSLFDDPFFKDPFFSFSTGTPKTLASDPLEISVRSLPEDGRPVDFSGLVGNYKIESRLEPSSIKVGESATLTVFLSGRGNVNRIPDLKMPELDQTKIYADQPALEMETDAKGLTGSKTMKWALVPEKEGIFRIPPLTVSFFDTQRRQYKVIETAPHTLSVLAGEKEPAQITQKFSKDADREGPVKQEVKELGRDILPVHGSVRDVSAGFQFQTGGFLFWIVLLAPFFVYSATFLGLKFRNKSLDSIAAVKVKKAAKTFIKKCRHESLSSSDLSLSIKDYINDRFGLSLGSLTSGEATEVLQSNGVSPETSERLRSLIQGIEDAIYTGKGQEICHMGDDIPQLIKQIEKEIR